MGSVKYLLLRNTLHDTSETPRLSILYQCNAALMMGSSGVLTILKNVSLGVDGERRSQNAFYTLIHTTLAIFTL